MKQEDKWLDGLRYRMKDYSEPVPEGLWADIEKELESPKVVPMWRRWQAVAAVALLVVVSSLTWWMVNSPATQYIEEQSMQIAEVTPVTMEEPRAPLLAEEKPLVVMKKKKTESDSILTIIHLCYDLEENAMAPEDSLEEDTKEIATDTEKQEPERKSNPTSTRRKIMVQNLMAQSSQKKNSSWSLGVSVGNGALNLYYGEKQMTEYDLSVPQENWNGYPPVSAPDSTTQTPNEGSQQKLFSRGASRTADIDYGAFEKKHRTPFVVGISLRWMLNEDWALESGLTYTRLATDLSAGSMKGEQKLHYIGIPLKVSRKVWADNRWSVYAGAGGAVEKCVSGQLTVNNKWQGEEIKRNLDVDELQWSLQASVGVQYRLAGQLGIYAEPGVAYYFDDGSQVETIRKEKPFHFNVQVGLRFTLPK